MTQKKSEWYMSVPASFIRNRVLSASSKTLYLVLLSYADEKGECYPSRQSISEGSGLSERSIRTHLEALKEAGFIEWVNIRIEGHIRCLYRLSKPGSNGQILPAGNVESQRANSAGGQRANSARISYTKEQKSKLKRGSSTPELTYLGDHPEHGPLYIQNGVVGLPSGSSPKNS